MRKPIVRVVVALVVGLAFGFVFGRIGRKPAPRPDPGFDFTQPVTLQLGHDLRTYQPYMSRVDDTTTAIGVSPVDVDDSRVIIILAGGRVVVGALRQ